MQKPFQVPHTHIEQFTLDNGLRVVDVLQRGRNARTGASESQVAVILAERPGATDGRPDRTPAPIVDQARFQRALQREYAKLALFPDRPYAWPIGRTDRRSVR